MRVVVKTRKELLEMYPHDQRLTSKQRRRLANKRKLASERLKAG